MSMRDHFAFGTFCYSTCGHRKLAPPAPAPAAKVVTKPCGCNSDGMLCAHHWFREPVGAAPAPDRTAKEAERHNCPRCGGDDLEYVTEEYGTGVVAPDGYEQRETATRLMCRFCDWRGEEDELVPPAAETGMQWDLHTVGAGEEGHAVTVGKRCCRDGETVWRVIRVVPLETLEEAKREIEEKLRREDADADWNGTRHSWCRHEREKLHEAIQHKDAALAAERAALAEAVEIVKWSRQLVLVSDAPQDICDDYDGKAKSFLAHALTTSAGEADHCDHCGKRMKSAALHVTHDMKALCSGCLSQVSD